MVDVKLVLTEKSGAVSICRELFKTVPRKGEQIIGDNTRRYVVNQVSWYLHSSTMEGYVEVDASWVLYNE